jgi:hypothetical protein
VKKLLIADDLSLPLDAVTQKLACLGRTGSGKTFAAKRIVEQMLRAGAQVVILDGSGGWAGLRLGPKAFKIPVLGGFYGDIPLESTAGALVADVIVDRRTSMVLDVSQMLDAERTRFATAFAQRFFQRKKASPGAVHLVLEECQDFVPENCQRGEEQMLHEFQRLAKQGRPHGIGLTLISQRPQEISKKALNQTECVFAFQMNGPHERKALQYWLSDKGFEGKLADVLPTLEVGCPYVWSPQWLKVSKVVRILPIESLDTSSTPKVGKKGVKQKTLKTIDLKELNHAMAETLERAKADDPKELRKQIAERDRRIHELEKVKPAAALKGRALKDDEIAVRRMHLERMLAVVGGLEQKIEGFAKVVVGMEKESRTMLIEANRSTAEIRRAAFTGSDVPAKRLEKAPKMTASEMQRLAKLPTGIVTIGEKTKSAIEKHAAKTNGMRSNGSSEKIPTGERAILIAAAQHPDGVTRAQLTALTGYKRSSRDAYVSRLIAASRLERNGDRLCATESGKSDLGSDYIPLPTGRALLEHWLSKLPEGERRILEFVSGQHPNVVERGQIDEFTGYKRSSRDAYISRLGARELVVTDRDGVRISEDLFG